MNDDSAAEQWFQRGLELFNQEDFFASHEVWEEAWKRTQGEQRLCCQGLIQLAAALLHAQRHNPRGAGALWAKAEEKLARLPPDYQGLELDGLRRDVADFFAHYRHDASLPRLPKLHRWRA